MNRTAAILITLLVLLVAVQPVLAFHFCSGRLVSVEVATENNVNTCCSGTQHSGTSGDNIIKGTCCHTTIATLSADNYVHQEARQQTIPLSISTIISAGNILSGLISEPAVSTWHNTPPGYLPATGKDHLVRFCVYII